MKKCLHNIYIFIKVHIFYILSMKTLPLASENPREQFLNTRSLTLVSKVCTWYQQESGHAMLGYPSHAECIHNMPRHHDSLTGTVFFCFWCTYINHCNRKELRTGGGDNSKVVKFSSTTVLSTQFFV